VDDLSAPRTILVSNRLPITATVVDGALQVERSVGGLATALSGATQSSRTLWIGWPGPTGELGRAHAAELERRLHALDCVSVRLSGQEIREYYEAVSNGVLWPLLHYQAERLPLSPDHWDTYVAVNQRFADRVADVWRQGDDIWVHDYQLMLLPELLRRRFPGARIGFFLHVPFPAADVFRILPWRKQVLEGVLGADVIGFHTQSYADHFQASVRALLAAPAGGGVVRHDGRDVMVKAYPIGIDAPHFEALAGRPFVRAAARELTVEGVQLLAGVDRLDYTKGIPRRLLAFRRLLERHPELHGKVRLIQIVVPSREAVRTYREFRTQVEAAIGRINGTFGTANWTPVNYVYRSLDEGDLSALYVAADVMLVTPVRDGMNLVAKEFVASRPELSGVLVLSEFTGAADQLSEAVLVNPYDVDGTAEALHRALMMPRAERRARMQALREHVCGATAAAWASAFLADLSGPPAPGGPLPAVSSQAALDEALERARRGRPLVLLLDYDGTLVPFTGMPLDAAPDATLLSLLERLAACPDTEVHIVSGRSRPQLDEWLGALPLGLHAEHGLWSRRAGALQWDRGHLDRNLPHDRLLALMHDRAEQTPGALVEQKSAGLAWHYRMAEEQLGELQAGELALELEPLAAAHGLDILRGAKVLEVRPKGIHKGVIVAEATATLGGDGLVLAMGDDRTDEDLFAALPEGAIAVHVGPSESRAPLRIADVAAAREFLRALAEC
jgi:trehalose 6-phosphate synthase/phosphatase